MGAFLAGLTAVALAAAPADTLTSPFATAATRAAVERAMARLHAEDSSVQDYTARLRYRLTLSFGRRRWGRSLPAAVEEQEGRVQWQRPNDLRVEILGRRQRSRSDELDLQSVFDRPWFVPRSVGDSVRIFSDDFPAIAPLHPLARSGPDWYRYALVDSLRIQPPGSASLLLYQVAVAPARTGLSLVTGHLWLDAETGEVVRFAFRYVGTGGWVRPDEADGVDSSDARRANRLISRWFSLDADLEYARQAGGHWMPYRQTIAGRLRIPVVSDLVIPFEAVTTFRDYEINAGAPLVFTVPLPDTTLGPDSLRALRMARRDSLRAARRRGEALSDSLLPREYAGAWSGGRYEVRRAPFDSLSAYGDWGDTLSLAADAEHAAKQRDVEAELARLADSLPGALTGRRRSWFGFERTADAAQFNRVQGWSTGLGVGWRPGPAFTTVFATVRYGRADERVTGRLTVDRNGPGWRLGVSGYRDLADVDPFQRGRTIANSVNAAITGHDYGDYLLTTGGSATLDAPLGDRVDLRVRGAVERQQSAAAVAGGAFGGDIDFPANPAVAEGTFGTLAAALRGRGPVRWGLGAEAIGGEGEVTGRLFGDARLDLGATRGATLRVKAGYATSPTLPQFAFRAGGPQTVRGFDLGAQAGQAMWAAQLDVSPFGGWLRPVAFADVGWAGDPSRLGDDRPLVGAGVGLSLYSKLFRAGLLRFDLSRAMSPERPRLRFDIVFSAVR